MKIEDNEILLLALDQKSKGYDVQFISKDLNARVKADALGIATEDYLKEYVTPNDFYKGWYHVTVPAVQLNKEVPDAVNDLIAEKKLVPNEFIWVESQHNPYNYRVFRYTGGPKLISVDQPHLQWPLKARNPQQLMALDLLLDPEIQLVTLFGPAGTGKTFLVLLAGLHEVLVNHNFEKLLIARPVVPLGKDVGYLPGTLQEKLYSWMLPVYDNMELIVHNAGMKGQAGHDDDHWSKDYYRGRKKGHRNGKGHDRNRIGLQPLDDLVEQGKISLEAITYMRGRSIPYQYILIDEVQNLTPHEVKTLVSRVGEGSKIILAGDPYQIDAPYLEFSSNGLVNINEKFKGQRLFGSVYLEKSERSELSKLVTELL
jgi:PhoH-like ATPase